MPGWLAFSLAALILWGVWGVLTKVATSYMSPQVAYLISALGYIPAVGFLLVATGFKIPWHPIGWAAALGAGLCTAFALLCFYFAIASGAASVVVPLTSLYLGVTVLLSYILLKESMSLRHLTGIILALVAVWLLAK